MFNLEKFIADSVTNRPVSMFAADIEANKETLTAEIKGKKVCVIGGAGSIGSSFIKAVLRFEPASVVVVDLNENGLAELVRDIRSTESLYVPEEFRCYTLNFADPIFECIFREERLRHRCQFLCPQARTFGEGQILCSGTHREQRHQGQKTDGPPLHLSA